VDHQTRQADEDAKHYKARIERSGGRMKKTTIVAMARKLLVALWKYVTSGVVIEGAVMKKA
jgi:transposase